MTKGPHRRHNYVVCPTCNTELRADVKHTADSKTAWVVCPECDTHVPVARAS